MFKKERFKLLKKFPGMEEPVGTIFQRHPGWSSTLGTEDKHFCTAWTVKEYFEPYVGEFFEMVK